MIMGYRSLYLFLLVLQLYFTLLLCRPSASVDYSNAEEAASKTSEPFAKYDTTTVILHLRDNLTGQAWKSTYWPRVDEFTQLEIYGSYLQQFQGKSFVFNPNLTISVEFNNRTLLSKRVYSAVNELIIPYFTAVVLLDNGRVHDFAWQDGCSDCLSSRCLDNQCGNLRWDGKTDICSKVNCAIKVFFAWSGRDKDDTACRSIASTPLNFKQYSLTPAANFGNGLWGDFIYKFTIDAPNPTDQQA